MRVLVVTNMYPTSENPAFGTFVRDQVESLEKQGVEIDVFFVDGRRNKLNYLLAFPRLWKHLLTNKYDLVHAHYVFSGLIARAQLSCPVVLTHHGPEVLMTWQAPLCYRVTPWFNEVIVVSREMYDRLDYPDAKIIPCGVDFDVFKPMPKIEAREVLDLPLDRKLVLWAGEYWRPEKRFDLVEAAMSKLKLEDPSVDLVLLSGKPHAEVPMYMNACDALLLVSDGEGSPMVVKEAMACNLPVVSVHVGDVPDVIGRTPGCYLTSREADDIVAKLHTALGENTRTNGREHISNMSMDSIASRIINVYHSALGRRFEEQTEPSTLPGRR